MPELPEVETVKNRLYPLIEGRTILRTEVFYDKYECLLKIQNQKIEGMSRKGKHLIFILGDYQVVSHLRMEGKYFIRDNAELEKHDLVRFTLSDGKYMFYNDVRKFGVFHVFDKDTDICKEEPLISVGDEPFDITNEKLYGLLKSKKEPIKTALLDQTVMSGLGNIYVDEVLYVSKLNPFMSASDVTMEDIENIINASIDILNKAIELGGSTIRSFASLNGESGHAQGALKIHLRAGERCLTCGNIVLKDRCGGRGTYYCPSCQRSNRNSYVYAITGGYSGGKSTSLSILKEMGYDTYSCDDIYKELFLNSKEMRREIKREFKTLEIDELRNIVFTDENKNSLLKSITHKYVMGEIFSRIMDKRTDISFVEVPLLFESTFENAFDKTICVSRPKEMLDEILSSRGVSREDYERRASSQLSEEEKEKRSDFVIHNDSTKEELRTKIEKLLEKLEEK